MKRKMLIILSISFFLAQSGLIFAGALIAEPGLSAVSDGQSVVLTWQTTQEQNLRYFVVQRRTAEGSFVDLGYVNPEGDKYYEYIDRAAYKTEDAVFIYRLKIVNNDGTEPSYSGDTSVLHNVSSVRKTWGSIKALFR